jgi:hypothetical protein
MFFTFGLVFICPEGGGEGVEIRGKTFGTVQAKEIWIIR